MEFNFDSFSLFATYVCVRMKYIDNRIYINKIIKSFSNNTNHCNAFAGQLITLKLINMCIYIAARPSQYQRSTKSFFVDRQPSTMFLDVLGCPILQWISCPPFMVITHMTRSSLARLVLPPWARRTWDFLCLTKNHERSNRVLTVKKVPGALSLRIFRRISFAEFKITLID